VLALAYWRAPGLPQTLEAVPLEYFVRAVDWAKARPEIDPRRVGVLGWSRGAEAALLLASHDADVKAVIALAPTANVWSGLNPARMADADAAWTFGGRPLPALVPVGGPGTTSLKDLFVHGLDHAGEHPETAIPVEKINGPVLMLTGVDDPIWPSSRMAELAMARLDERGFPFDHRHVDYPDAGHLVFAAEGADLSRISPAARAMLGGSESANAAARSASWPLALDFTDQALKGKAR